MISSRLLPLSLLLAAACAPPGLAPGTQSPLTGHPWVVARTTAQRAVLDGAFSTADSVLAVFAQRHAGTPEAAEASYWRGFYQLDPANAAGSPALAVASFDAYLQSRQPMVHQAEAQALRRIAARMDSLEAPILAAAAAAGGARPARPSAAAVSRDEEVARLREELRRSNEELERIRRRLATPRPDEQPPAAPPPAQQPAPQQPPAQRPPR